MLVAALAVAGEAAAAAQEWPHNILGAIHQDPVGRAERLAHGAPFALMLIAGSVGPHHARIVYEYLHGDASAVAYAVTIAAEGAAEAAVARVEATRRARVRVPSDHLRW